jgi:hypothetical protein
MKKLICAIGCLIVSYFAASAWAQTAPQPPAEPAASGFGAATDAASAASVSPSSSAPTLSLMVSPYTYHFNPKPTHRHVYQVGLEREYANAKLDGLVLFTNSFGQPSIYLYPWGGVYKSIFGVDKLAFKWTGGVIWGYRGEYKDEVANIGGFAPALIFGLAYTIKPGWEVQYNQIGKAAMQFQINMALD